MYALVIHAAVSPALFWSFHCSFRLSQFDVVIEKKSYICLRTFPGEKNIKIADIDEII
jgi:hypothetical protein